MGLMDQPGGRHIHREPTPRSGGLALGVAFFVPILVAVGLDLFTPDGGNIIECMRCWVGISAMLMLLGIADDRFSISPRIKLLGQLVVAILAWNAGFQLESLLGIDLPSWFDALVTVGLFTAGMNAYNLIDGMDGVAGGLGAVTSIGLGGLNLLLDNVSAAALCFALTGACIGFLRYNFHPAKVFLGDTGSMLIGFLLVSLTFQTSARGAASIMLIVPLLTLGVPLMDAVLAVWRRSVRKFLHPKGESKLSSGDKDHLHHRLARRGLTQRKVAGVLYVLQSLIFFVGLLWVNLQDFRMAIFTLGFFVGSFVLFRYLATLEMNDSGRYIVEGLHRPTRSNLLSSVMPFLDVAAMGSSLFFSTWLLLPYHQGEIQQFTPFLQATAPSLIGLPLVLLWLTRLYRRQWSKARPLDFLYVGFVTFMGISIGISLSPILWKDVHFALLFGTMFSAFSVPLMLLMRAFPRVVQDLIHYHERRKSEHDSLASDKVLVYGAGYGYTLLTRSETFNRPGHYRSYYLFGLIDDNPLLKGKTVHGYPVLGSIRELDSIVKENGIHEVILSTELKPRNMRKLMDIAEANNLRIRRSQFRHTILRKRSETFVRKARLAAMAAEKEQAMI